MYFFQWLNHLFILYILLQSPVVHRERIYSGEIINICRPSIYEQYIVYAETVPFAVDRNMKIIISKTDRNTQHQESNGGDLDSESSQCFHECHLITSSFVKWNRDFLSKGQKVKCSVVWVNMAVRGCVSWEALRTLRQGPFTGYQDYIHRKYCYYCVSRVYLHVEVEEQCVKFFSVTVEGSRNFSHFADKPVQTKTSSSEMAKMLTKSSEAATVILLFFWPFCEYLLLNVFASGRQPRESTMTCPLSRAAQRITATAVLTTPLRRAKISLRIQTK